MMLDPSLAPALPGSAPLGPCLGLSPSLTLGFLPAFRHQRTGEVRLCQDSDGRIAQFHLLDAVPSYWVSSRDWDGRPSALVSDIEAGYVRGSEFWSLVELTNPTLDG